MNKRKQLIETSNILPSHKTGKFKCGVLNSIVKFTSHQLANFNIIGT